MANNVIASTIQHRHDTAANWASVNPVLLIGEIGVETDTNKLKIGNGSSTWTALAYFDGASNGLPNGGTAGQVLSKVDSTDGNANWKNIVTKYTVSVPTANWTGTGPYSQTITVAGIVSTDVPVMDVVLNSTDTTAENELVAYSYIGRIDTDNNSITLKCYKTKPTIDLTIILVVTK